MILSIVLSIGLYSITSAQTLKTFNGEYDDGTVNKGHATYTYYEDKTTLEYIKQGAFKFTYSDKDATSSQQVVIAGNYNHNKKNGAWSYTIIYNDWPTNGNTYNTGTKTLTANYENGLPNGAWLYKYDGKEREKRFTLNGYTWTPYKPLSPEMVSANFKDGIITGSVKFINNPPYSEYTSIIGQFDNNGFMSGTWVYKSPDNEKIVEFKNGILTKFIVRENASGKILSKEIDDAEMSQIKDKYITGAILLEGLKKMKIKVDTIFAVQNNDYDFKMSFKSDDFRFKYVPGDETYYYQKSIYDEKTYVYTQQSGWIDIRNEGLFVLFTQVPTYKLTDIQDYSKAVDFIGKGNYGGAKELFESVLQQNEANLSDSDTITLNAKIREVELKLKQ